MLYHISLLILTALTISDLLTAQLLYTQHQNLASLTLLRLQSISGEIITLEFARTQNCVMVSTQSFIPVNTEQQLYTRCCGYKRGKEESVKAGSKKTMPEKFLNN